MPETCRRKILIKFLDSQKMVVIFLHIESKGDVKKERTENRNQ